MDTKTREILEALKQYFDELEVSHKGYEDASRIFMLAYAKFMELSAYLSPDMGADKLAKAHLEITSAIREVSEAINETKPED